MSVPWAWLTCVQKVWFHHTWAAAMLHCNPVQQGLSIVLRFQQENQVALHSQSGLARSVILVDLPRASVYEVSVDLVLMFRQ